MKSKRGNLLMGVVLILIGGFFMAVNLGWMPELSQTLWSLVFAAISVLFFVTYFASGVKNWGLLFPAFGAAAIAGILWLERTESGGPLSGSLFMLMISVPFWVAFVIDRRTNWWAMIPGWATAVIGLIVLFEDRVGGDLIGALIMFAIALPFFVVYIKSRANWWALIPAWVLTVIGVVVLLESVVSGDWIGVLMMFAIGIPFFVVYFARPKNWWALIPAGVMSSIGVVIILGSMNLSDGVAVRLMGGTMFAGIGLTFAALWARRHVIDTDWAKYPAVGLLGAALLIVTFGAAFEYIWPLALIGLGLWLAYHRPRIKEKS